MDGGDSMGVKGLACVGKGADTVLKPNGILTGLWVGCAFLVLVAALMGVMKLFIEMNLLFSALA